MYLGVAPFVVLELILLGLVALVPPIAKSTWRRLAICCSVAQPGASARAASSRIDRQFFHGAVMPVALGVDAVRGSVVGGFVGGRLAATDRPSRSQLPERQQGTTGPVVNLGAPGRRVVVERRRVETRRKTGHVTCSGHLARGW